MMSFEWVFKKLFNFLLILRDRVTKPCQPAGFSHFGIFREQLKGMTVLVVYRDYYDNSVDRTYPSELLVRTDKR